VIDVAEFTMKLVAATPPNDTAVVPVKPVPVMTTLVPPATGPLFGAIVVTVGAAAFQVNVPALTVLDVPYASVTVLLAAACAGEYTVSWVLESWLIAVPAVVSNCTPVTPYMFVPVMTTAVPPLIGPDVGAIPDTVAAPYDTVA
jgi:hypothetical protein